MTTPEGQLQVAANGVQVLDVITAAAVLAASLGASYLFLLVLRRRLVPLVRRGETRLDDAVLSILRGPVYLFIVVYAGIWLLRFLAARYPGQIPASLFPTVDLVYELVLVLVGTWTAFKIFGILIDRYAGRLAHQTGSRVDNLLTSFFGRLGKFVIVLLGVSAALYTLNYDPTAFLAGLGIAGLAIALAMQDTLANMISSIYIMVDKKYKVGDRVLLPTGELCDVREVSLRATRLYNVGDHTMITMPNNELAKMKIVNWSEPDRRMKLNLSLNVSFQTDVEKAKRVLVEAATGQEHVLPDPPPESAFSSFQESSLELGLTVWVDDFRNLGDVRDELNSEIKRRFDQERIEIAYPTRTVLMKPSM